MKMLRERQINCLSTQGGQPAEQDVHLKYPLVNSRTFSDSNLETCQMSSGQASFRLTPGGLTHFRLKYLLRSRLSRSMSSLSGGCSGITVTHSSSWPLLPPQTVPTRGTPSWLAPPGHVFRNAAGRRKCVSRRPGNKYSPMNLLYNTKERLKIAMSGQKLCYYAELCHSPCRHSIHGWTFRMKLADQGPRYFSSYSAGRCGRALWPLLSPRLV